MNYHKTSTIICHCP